MRTMATSRTSLAVSGFSKEDSIFAIPLLYNAGSGLCIKLLSVSTAFCDKPVSVLEGLYGSSFLFRLPKSPFFRHGIKRTTRTFEHR